MIRNLFRQRALLNERKFYKPNFKLHNTHILKNKNNVLFEEEPIKNFLKIQGKYKFLKDSLDQEEKKVKQKLKQQTIIRKTKGYDFNEIKKFAENIKFDKITNMVLGVGFEKDLQLMIHDKEQVEADVLKFEESFTQLVESLGTLSDVELIQFLRHSIALKASKLFENQASGILLKESIKSEIDKRYKNETEKVKAISELTNKLAMKIVYGKIDEILKQKNQESSYQNNNIVQMILEDPYINPNSFFAQDVLSQIYKEGEQVFKFRTNEDALSPKNLYEQNFQRNYFQARVEVLCRLGDVDINQDILVPKNEIRKIDSKVELESREQNDLRQLTLTLKDILADYTIQNNLNNSIKNLERQLNIYQKEIPSLEKIAVQLDQSLRQMPKHIYQKYFNKNQTSPDKSKYINKNYKQEELQWNTVNTEIPCEIMRVDEQEDELERLNKIGKIESIQRDYSFYHNANPILYEQQAEEDYYENSDQEPDEHTTNAWEQVQDNFEKHLTDSTDLKNIIELNSSYTDLMRQKLYIARNPQSKEKGNEKTVKLQQVPDDLVADRYFFFTDQEVEKTNKHNYAIIDEKYLENELEDKIANHNTSIFNFITKKTYDKFLDSKNLQAIRSILGRDVFGSKLHKYIFHNGSWKIGNKLPVRTNNYRCLDQKDENYYDTFSLNFGDNEVSYKLIEQYNDYLISKYDKFRKTSSYQYLDTDFKLFKQDELVSMDETFDAQPQYRQLVEYYKQSNKSYFYSHYIQTALKEFQLFSKEQKFDTLEQEIDPNYGFYNVKSGISEYSEQYIKQKENDNLMVAKLNPCLQNQEQKLENLKEMYPNLFKSKNPQNKKDQEKFQIFSAKGSRKRARATAVLKIPGTGKVKVNNREFTEYFFRGDDRSHALKPIRLIYKEMEVDVEYFVHGGNVGTQSEAAKLALARAVCKAYPEYTNHFRNLHFLYRDPRTKERKKINSYGARKSYTYVRR